MHFHDMPYRRVSCEEVQQRYEELIQALQSAESGADCLAVLRRRNQLVRDMTPVDLCFVRHDMDVNDPFYAAEQDYYDEIGPKLTDLSNQFDRALLDSPHRAELEQYLGHQAMAVLEQTQEGFDSRLIPLAQEENALVSRYNRLTSNATVEWEGRTVKRSLMATWLQSSDRDTRRRAFAAVSDSWQAQQEELEEIYDLLVANRTRQAALLGFDSYTDMSYRLMCRIGYGPEEVRRFREQVKRSVVPLHLRLEERRRQRLGLDALYPYDTGFFFPEGNPPLLGGTDACLEATRTMYTRLSPETGEFIAYLLDNGLYDVEIRDGKRSGGYMMFLEQYRAPFIFANFDGTTENAYIMCHEGGHAFQGYLKRDEELRERRCATSETAETHAMAMEFFTWPYMELFFGARAEDYRTMHLEDAVRLIVSQCQQDEFQQLVYDNPAMTRAERDALWARLNREYFPGRNYSGENSSYLAGCGWQRIPHMYQWPFYAIDYALAQVCALEYLRWSREDSAGAWQSYLDFCRRTGTEDFPGLVQKAGLDDPFAEGTLSTLVNWLEDRLL